MESHVYNVTIEWSDSRKGMMCSPDLVVDGQQNSQCVAVATPPEFPKGIPGIWSPEHLFTAAVSSCLMTTFLAIAENSKLPFKSFVCPAKGKLERIDGKFLMTEIELQPEVILNDEKDRERALKVLEKSEAQCLISNSIKSKVTMTPVIKVEETEIPA